MAGHIPRSFIDDLLARLDIVDIIAELVVTRVVALTRPTAERVRRFPGHRLAGAGEQPA